MRLVLLNEILEDADVIAALASSLRVYSTRRSCLGTQNGVHVGVLHARALHIGSLGVGVREVTSKLSVGLIVISRIHDLLLLLLLLLHYGLLLLLLLHVDHVHVLLGRGRGSAEHAVDGLLLPVLPSGLQVIA